MDLTKLPPTNTFVGDLVPFYESTIDYVARIRQAGVPTEFPLYPGCFHGFEVTVPDAEVSQRAKSHFIQALKHALHESII